MTISLAFSLASSKVLDVSIQSLKPTIAFNGVLISWDILLKNSVLAWFALSACSLAIFICSTIFISGFSIVWYMINKIKNSITVVNVISGWVFCSIATIIIKTTNKKMGIVFFLFIVFIFLTNGIIQHSIASIEHIYTQFTDAPVANPKLIWIGKIIQPKQQINQIKNDILFKMLKCSILGFLHVT